MVSHILVTKYASLLQHKFPLHLKNLVLQSLGLKIKYLAKLLVKFRKLPLAKKLNSEALKQT